MVYPIEFHTLASLIHLKKSMLFHHLQLTIPAANSEFILSAYSTVKNIRSGVLQSFQRSRAQGTINKTLLHVVGLV
jgi:hypothetical protein